MYNVKNEKRNFKIENKGFSEKITSNISLKFDKILLK